MLSVSGLARASLGNATGSLIAAVGAFGLNVAATRLLGLKLAGAYFESLALVTISITVCMWGADVGVSRAIPSGMAGRGARPGAIVGVAVIPVAILGLLIVLGAEIAAGPIGSIVAPNERGPFISAFRVMVLAIPIMAVERILTSSLRGLGLTVPTVVLEGLTLPLIRLGIAAGLGVLFHRPVVFAAAWALPSLIACSWAALWLRRALLAHSPIQQRHQSNGGPRTLVWNDFWKFSLSRGLADLVGTAGQWSGVVLVGALASARAAGIYGAVNRVAFAGTLALTSANAVLAPRIARAMAVRNRHGVELLYGTVTAWAVGFGAPIFVVLALFASTVLEVFGRGLSTGATGLVVLAVAMLWNLLTGPATIALLMSGHSRLNLANAACSVTCLVVFSVVLIPRYGVSGAAVSWAVGIAVENGAALIEINRVLRMKVLSKNAVGLLSTSVLLFGSIGLVLHLCGLAGFVGLCLEVGLSAPLYVLLLHLLGLSGPLISLVGSKRKGSEDDIEGWAQTG